MDKYNSIDHFSDSNQLPTVVTIGTFDGVHLGHQYVLKQLINHAQKDNLKTVLLTFYPHPRIVLQNNSQIKLLNTQEEKLLRLSQLGIQTVITHPFSLEFSRLSAQEFVEDILVKKINVKKIIIGYDHRFGKNRTSTVDDLIKLGKQYHFEVIQISAQEIDHISVSSTKIRKALDLGNIPLANSYLGYRYLLSGKVTQGKGTGKTIGFPTAKIKLTEPLKQLPLKGVYFIQSQIENKTQYGMLNIGYNPSTSMLDKLSIEVHFFNFTKELYHQELSIEFISRIREEINFPSIKELKNQLTKDMNQCLSMITHAKKD